MTLAERMEALAALLAERCPSRRVTRSLRDFAERQPAELKRGIVTLLSLGESDYANLRDRAAMDGRHRMLLVGQIQVHESADAQSVEDAEFALVEQIKDVMRHLPAGFACLEMKAFRQSGQIEHPYGWIAVDLEMPS
jgi:hypothetical protein